MAVCGPRGVLELRGDEGHRFAWASVTKLLSALAVLVACEEGTTSLDEPAGPPGSTVRHLLSHASGLGPSDAARPLVAPGRRRIYSNAGYEVLARHLEQRAGIDFATYLAESVLEPAGLAGAALTGSPASGAGGRIADLVALCAELLAPRTVHADTLAAASTPAFPELDGVLPGFGHQSPCPWGLGPEIRGDKAPHWTGAANSRATFGHFGQSGTFVWVDPDARIACAVLTDRAFGDWAARTWPPFSDAVLAAYAPDRRRGAPPGGAAASRVP